jgi:DNA-binding transcriptional LysR family regulator
MGPTSKPLQLAEEKTISLQMLANEDFLLPEKSKTLYRLCLSACKQSGFKPRVAHADSKFENLIDLVTEGMGIALLWKQLALYDSNPQVAIVDISPSMTSHIYLCYLKGVRLSNAAAHFVLCTRQYIENRRKS